MEEKNKNTVLKENAVEIREWLEGKSHMTDAEKETASQILWLLEGMRICEAKMLLESCKDFLSHARIAYSLECPDTSELISDFTSK